MNIKKVKEVYIGNKGMYEIKLDLGDKYFLINESRLLFIPFKTFEEAKEFMKIFDSVDKACEEELLSD